MTESDQYQNLETIGEVSEASHTLIQSHEFQQASLEIKQNQMTVPSSAKSNNKQMKNSYHSRPSENDIKIDSLESDEINIAIENTTDHDQGKSSIGMQSGDSTSHRRKPSMFADLNLPNGSKTARISIPSPASLKEKLNDNRNYKNDYLKLRPRESSDTESTNIYTARRKNLESDLRSLEL